MRDDLQEGRAGGGRGERSVRDLPAGGLRERPGAGEHEEREYRMAGVRGQFPDGRGDRERMDTRGAAEPGGNGRLGVCRVRCIRQAGMEAGRRSGDHRGRTGRVQEVRRRGQDRRPRRMDQAGQQGAGVVLDGRMVRNEPRVYPDGISEIIQNSELKERR